MDRMPLSPAVVEVLEGRALMSAGPAGELQVVGDWNGDGRADLAVFADGSVRLSLGRGDGTFGPSSTMASPFGRSAVQVAAGDVNGDGLADLIGLDGKGLTGVSMNRGKGIFDDPFFFDAFAGDGLGSSHSVRVAAGDVNGDGRAEIVNFGDDGSVAVARISMKAQGVWAVEVTSLTDSSRPDWIE